jgi:hypothetical protein
MAFPCRALVAVIGGDSFLRAVFGALLANERSRMAASTFFEQVMLW